MAWAKGFTLQEICEKLFLIAQASERLVQNSENVYMSLVLSYDYIC